jgi:hypothetical protein
VDDLTSHTDALAMRDKDLNAADEALMELYRVGWQHPAVTQAAIRDIIKMHDKMEKVSFVISPFIYIML